MNQSVQAIRLSDLVAISTIVALLGGLGWFWLDSQAQVNADCSAPYYVDETLPNGGRWELCWEHRSLDGVVLRDIYFTTPSGVRSKILGEASIAQVHVPYDDNTARFHDITDDGFGDSNLSNLTDDECPNGTLLPYDNKNVVCLQTISRGHAFRTGSQQQQGYALKLFSVSTSGEYNYIPEWYFGDDGSIRPIMGAAGKLQRFGTSTQFGWPIRNNNVVGISHIHNYYYRLDFDLGDSGSDDIVEEMNLMPATNGNGRSLAVSRLEREASRSVEPSQMRSWRIRDGNRANADGHFMGYQIDPLQVSHRDVGPSFEPWTEHDFYVTQYNPCERYTSHNSTFNGCAGNVAAFVNEQSLLDADLVLWYGVTFHHVPRDEDEPYMHAHWDGFQLTPLDWTAENEFEINLPPQAIFTLDPMTGNSPLMVTVDAAGSTDPDGQIASYSWDFGNGSQASGAQVNYTYDTPGNYTITLTVTDNEGEMARATRTLMVMSPCPLGDVNCDEAVNVIDALFVLQGTRGSRTPTTQLPLGEGTFYGPACDVDDNGQCDLTDSTMIFECSTGIKNTFCSVSPEAEEPDLSIPQATSTPTSTSDNVLIYIPLVE